MRITLCMLALLGLPGATGASGADPSIYANMAKDTGESSYIERLSVSVTDAALVLRFEGKLELGRLTNAVQRNTGRTFHHADTKLVVTLDNEVLEAFPVTVAPDAAGRELAVFPPGVTLEVDGRGVALCVPLQLVRYSPVEVSAEMHSVYYAAADQMTAGEGRNLFATEDGPARVEIKSLGVKPGAPTVADLEVTEVGSGSVSLRWRTTGRTTADVSLEATGQAPRTVRQAQRSGEHKLTLTDLQPDTEYTASVSGTDFAGRPVTTRRVTFRTEAAMSAGAKPDAWLRVKGKYVVDWRGRPFPLGGYSHFLGEYWYNEFPRYGTPALTARYFRSVGFNSCRLGLWQKQRAHWAASIERQASSFERYGGPAGYVDRFLKPIVDQIVNEGVYVVIDWHWTYGLTPEDIEQIGQFWEQCAKAFKDEPRVAMYQLLNEPGFTEGQTRPDLAPRIRDIVKDYITRIRKHDQRHIILVPDWNCGWGWATESQWSPVNFDPGDPCRQIVYSKHIAKEHVTDAFMTGGVDAVADRWDVPFIFDEVELGPLMSSKDHAWFYDFLSRNPRKYGFWIWVCGQHPADLVRIASAFAQSYLPPAPFGATGDPPVVAWRRMDEPEAQKIDKGWQYRYTLAEPLPAGDYGLIIEGAPLGTEVGVAVVPGDDKSKLIGTWIGVPEATRWRWNGAYTVDGGTSAISGAVYVHAIREFTHIVVRLDKELDKDWSHIQLLRLDPKHQVPAPTVESPFVE